MEGVIYPPIWRVTLARVEEIQRKMLLHPVTEQTRRAKRVVVATQTIVPETLLAEIPVIFYTHDPHAGRYPPIARFTFDSRKGTVVESTEEYKRKDKRFHTIFIRPAEKFGAHLVGLTGGKYIRDAACYDLPSLSNTAHGCSSAEQILRAARGAEQAVVADIQIRFQTPGYFTSVRHPGGRVTTRSTLLNENLTGFPRFNRARAYVRALQTIPAHTPIHIRYPDCFWSHPHVRFRYEVLKPALSLLQQHVTPNRLHSQISTIRDDMQREGVVHVPSVFTEEACLAMDRVLGHIETEACMACGTRDLLNAVDDSYLEIAHRHNRLDLVHPELCHFAEFAPWATLMPVLLGGEATLIQGGLFRLFSTPRTHIPSSQVWHMDTDAGQDAVREGPQSMLVVVALTNVLLEQNGPTEVKLSREPERKSRHNPGFLDETQRKELVYQADDTRKIYMRRGDMMFLDARTLHRGTPNTSNTTRDWLYFSYGKNDLSHLREMYYQGTRSLFYDF